MKAINGLWRALKRLVFGAPAYAVLAGICYGLLSGWPFLKTALLAVLGLFFGFLLVKTIYEGIRCFKDTGNAYGSATFATKENLKAAGLLRNQGPIIGKALGRFLRFDKPGHLLTFAPTRSGKGVGNVIPNLLDHPGSVVVTDIKGENYSITKRHRKTIGPVFAFAPHEAKTARYNPLDFIRIGTPDELDDASLIADMLVIPQNHEDNFWDREAKNLLILFILYVVHCFPREAANLGTVRHLLQQNREDFDLTIEDMKVSSHSIVRRIAAGFSQKEDKERSGVISTASGYVALWDSPRMAHLTSRSDLDLRDLKNDIISLYLIVPPELVDVYKPFLRLMVGLSLAAMTRNRTRPPADVLFVLDEFAALDRMRPIEKGIGYLAGYNVRLWLFLQDLSQLQETYKKWRSFIANCAVRQVFNVQDATTAQMVSEMLGNETVKVESRNRSRHWLITPFNSSYGDSVYETGRPLLSPDAIMIMPQDKQILFVQGTRPILAEKIRYFEDKTFKGKWDRWEG